MEKKYEEYTVLSKIKAKLMKYYDYHKKYGNIFLDQTGDADGYLVEYPGDNNKHWIPKAEFEKAIVPKKVVELSDGYHTFAELYEHRTYLFSLLCKVFINQSWIAKKHSDGSMFEEMFIAGISTTEGDYTYHCNYKHLKMFQGIRELELAPDYDGHKSADYVRLDSLLPNELEKLGLTIDRVDNCIAGFYNKYLSPEVHVDSLAGILPEIANSLREVFFNLGGDKDTWGLPKAEIEDPV